VLTPGHPLTMHSFADTFQAVFKPAWSYSPSIGGYNPDAKYKAPLILVQSGSIAFGIVRICFHFNREVLQRCNHAMDLNVPGKTALTVGFIPARQAFHTVFKEDLTVPGRLAKQLRIATISIWQAMRRQTKPTARRSGFIGKNFGRVEIAKAADEQSGTDPDISIAVFG